MSKLKELWDDEVNEIVDDYVASNIDRITAEEKLSHYFYDEETGAPDHEKIDDILHAADNIR